MDPSGVDGPALVGQIGHEVGKSFSREIACSRREAHDPGARASENAPLGL